MKSFKLICKNCKQEFIVKASNVKYCNDCYADKKCYNINCNNIVHDIFINDNGNHFCSKKCKYQNLTYLKTQPGNCIKCGKYVENKDSTGRCSNCVSIQVSNSWKNITLENKINRLNGINSIPTFLDENPNCITHIKCYKQYYDISIESYICWECFKEF